MVRSGTARSLCTLPGAYPPPTIPPPAGAGGGGGRARGPDDVLELGGGFSSGTHPGAALGPMFYLSRRCNTPGSTFPNPALQLSTLPRSKQAWGSEKINV